MAAPSNEPAAPAIFDACIYTIRHSEDLDRDASRDGRGEYTEHTFWKTGYALFNKAKNTGVRMPVLFAAAERESGIIYAGFLESVKIEDSEPGNERTNYVVAGLRRVRSEPAKSTLILRSSGEKLSDQYIRPYAICETPPFVAEWDTGMGNA